jgi:hypothetical protein
MKKTITIMVLGVLGAIAGNASPIITSPSDLVTLNGTFFPSADSIAAGWGPGTVESGSALVNGVFRQQGDPVGQWNIGSIWWTGGEGNVLNPGNNIVVNLGGSFLIDSLTVQADDNDNYEVDYLAPGSSTWQVAWQIPSPGGWGLTTSSTILSTPIDATELRVEVNSGDGFYAVSQIQATGTQVPDAGSTLSLLGMSLTGLVTFARRLMK